MVKNHFIKNVITMLGGTSAALALSLLATPLLTQMYSPSAFGTFAIYMSICSIGAVAGTGRYELAIIIPKYSSEASYLAVLSSCCAAVISAAIGGAVFFALFNFPEIFKLDIDSRLWGVGVPLGIAGLCFVQIFIYWQMRFSNYKNISRARALQALSLIFFQFCFFPLFENSIGLIVGHFLGCFLATWLLVQKDKDFFRLKFTGLLNSFNKLIAVSKKYARFPKYMIPGQVANAISSQIPVLTLTFFYGAEHAGVYAVAERLTVLPCAVIANAIGEVFRVEAANIFRESGNCASLFLKTKIKLLVIGLAMASTVFFVAPHLLISLLGPEWEQSALLTKYLALIVLFQTISSPLSQTLILASMFKEDLIWQLFRLIVSFSTAWIAAYYLKLTFDSFVLAHCASFSFVYAVHSYLQYQAASGFQKIN